MVNQRILPDDEQQEQPSSRAVEIEREAWDLVKELSDEPGGEQCLQQIVRYAKGMMHPEAFLEVVDEESSREERTWILKRWDNDRKALRAPAPNETSATVYENFAGQFACPEHRNDPTAEYIPGLPFTVIADPERAMKARCDTCLIRNRDRDYPLSRVVASALLNMQMEAEELRQRGLVSETRLLAFVLELTDWSRSLSVVPQAGNTAAQQ